MNRIGVFVFYDERGFVDDYVCYLLNSIQEIVKRLIIITNGIVKNFGYEKLKQYSDTIFVRENYGYDAGAYKDLFTNFLSDENKF